MIRAVADFVLIRNSSVFLTLLVATFIFHSRAKAQEIAGAKTLTPDTAQINALTKKAYKLRESNTDSAGILYSMALNQSKQIGYRNGMGESLCGIARYYNIKNEQANAVDYIRRSFPCFENNQKGKQLYVSALVLMSESFFYLGAYDSCSFYRYEALNYIEDNPIDNPGLRLTVYSKILQYWLNAHEDIKQDKNIQRIMQHINELETQAVATNDSNLLVNVYFQKAGYYHNIPQNDSARYYGFKNIELGKRLKVTPSMLMACYLDIALTYIDDKQPLPAIENIQKAIIEAPAQGKATNRYLIFADIFLGGAYNMQGKFREAIALVVPALASAQQLNLNSILELAHKTLADAYDGAGQYKEAAEQRNLYAIAKDSLMKTEKMELSYNLEMKYRIAEKNKELAEKELSIAKNDIRIKNKNILIVCITAGLLLIVIISLFIQRNSKHKQKLQSEKISGLQQEMQIKTLKAMVSGSEKERSRIARDLHDGVSGTIGSVRARVGMLFRKSPVPETEKDFTDIMQLLEEASTEIRKTAHNLMPEILLQEGLVNATELFCNREAKNHPVNISFSHYGEIRRMPPDAELTLYRIIQELVNNLLKHANAANAIVQINFNGSMVGITVEDDGQGMPVDKDAAQFGAGLKTITERIHALNGSISIASKPMEGTSIYIEIDIDKIKSTGDGY